ncbi:MAG: hypothetical protein IPM66_21585 [Acidobacteriota bacterium]|nr:MAG: hypothetical protein IPM66_21585 [Acidobacteriota bacterium]
MKPAYRCQFCRKPLTDPQSIARGVGPECASKKAMVYSSAGTSDAELDRIAEFDPQSARLIRNALGFAGAKDIAWARRKLERVRSDVISINEVAQTCCNTI